MLLSDAKCKDWVVKIEIRLFWSDLILPILSLYLFCNQGG